MYCPQCGQQQVSDSLRFCSRCGFPLEGVLVLLGNGGALPVYQAPDEPREMSAKRKGVRQGGVLLLAGVVLVPALGLMDSFTQGFDILDILFPLAAILFFVGGLMRMLFAGIFEEGAKPRPPRMMGSYAPPMPSHLAASHRPGLPPGSAVPVGGWKGRPLTAEIRTPSSVTENTTRLLDKDESPSR